MRRFTFDKSTTRDKSFRYYVTSKLSENMHETPEGYLVCVGVPIARTGEMIYGEGETPLDTDDSGKVIINRDEAEVFAPETIASFEGKSITITHPTEFVGPENWSRLTKGTLQNVRRGEGDQKDDLIADLLITDSVAINLVKNGLREVSCGYEAEYTQTEEGRGVQTNIIGNHLALVDQGRAGSAYAINDHKGKGVSKMKMSDRIKAIFAKAQDEAMKMADEEEKKPDDKKEESKDASAIDQLVQMVKDLGEKVSALSGEKKKSDDADEEKPAKKEDKKDDEAKDEGEESPAEVSMEDRLKALETSVAKILESLSSEESEDADEEVEEGASEDNDFEESTMTGDTASRVEILAPGMDVKAKDAKKLALVAFGATKDGKAILASLSGGKAPTFDTAAKVETLFIAASEVLKAARSSAMAGTKQTRDSDSSASSNGPMTAEALNAINAKHYKQA